MKQGNNETINTISNYLSDILKEGESNNKIFEELVKMVKIIGDISSSVEQEEARKGFVRTVIELIQENKLKSDDLEKLFAEDLSQKVKKGLDEISVRLIADELIKTFEQKKITSEYIVAVIFGLAKGGFLTAPFDAEKYGKKLKEIVDELGTVAGKSLSDYINLILRHPKTNIINFVGSAMEKDAKIFSLHVLRAFVVDDVLFEKLKEVAGERIGNLIEADRAIKEIDKESISELITRIKEVRNKAQKVTEEYIFKKLLEGL